MPKYGPLTAYLRASGQAVVPVTWEKIEEVIDAKLPPSARQHRAWWSNNPSNNVMTRAWLAAGYESADVNMEGRRLVFRRSGAVGPPPDADDSAPAQCGPDGTDAPAERPFAHVFGALRGTVTTRPGTDLTAPTGAEWDAAR